MPKKQHNLLIILSIILIFLVLRILLLPTIEKYVSGNDASISGVMTKHLLEGKMNSFYMYGIQYNGGGVIGAYLAAPFFLVLGMSSLSVKLSSILVSLILLISIYFFTRNFFSNRIAILTVLLFTFSPGIFSRHNVRALPGYMPTLIFEVILLYLFFNIFYKNKKTPLNFILLGTISAIAMWNLEFIILLLFTMMLFWFFIDKKFILTKNFLIFLISFIITYSPVIYYNLINNLGNIKNMFYGTALNRLICSYNLLPKSIAICTEGQQFPKLTNPINFLINDLPSIFSSGKYYIYEIGIFSITSWIYYIIFIISFLFVLYINRKGFRELFNRKFSITNLRKEFIILILIILFSLSYITKGTHNVHYLLPIFPFVLIIMSIFLIYIYKKNKLLSLSLILILLLIGLHQNITLINAQTTTEGIGEYNKQNFEGIIELINFLKTKNINHIYTTDFIKWKVLFESKEEIIASCHYLCPCMTYNMPPYQEIVNNANNPAYIFFNDSDYNLRLINYLDENNITYKIEEMKAVNVYYNFSKPPRPKMVMEEWDMTC